MVNSYRPSLYFCSPFMITDLSADSGPTMARNEVLNDDTLFSHSSSFSPVL